jgi:hypothetical protein
MSIEEKKEFLSQWQQKAAAEGVLTVPPLHAALWWNGWGMTSPCQQPIGCWHAMGGAKYKTETRHPKSDPTMPDEFNKTPRCSGCRQPEKREAAAGTADVPGSGPLWENDRSTIMLGSRSSPTGR